MLKRFARLALLRCVVLLAAPRPPAEDELAARTRQTGTCRRCRPMSASGGGVGLPKRGSNQAPGARRPSGRGTLPMATRRWWPSSIAINISSGCKSSPAMSRIG